MIVENGYGLCLNNADSYVELEFANNYFSTRGETSWEDFTDEEKEVFLIKATDYVDNVFEWKGIKKTQEQSLNFPRKNLFDNDGYLVETIPYNLIIAVCECALIISKGLQTYKTENENGRVTSEHIGDLSFTYDYDKDKSINTTLYESINLRLRGLYKESKAKIYTGRVQRVS